MAIAHVKNWAKFQHYKDRSPPWIKLHRELLDDFNFARLPIASKALAPLIWMLAAESNDGTVNIDPEWLAFRLRWEVADVVAGLTPLIEKGFLSVASGVLAECLQHATPETETETEGEKKGAPVGANPRGRKKRDVTFAEWSAALPPDEDLIPADDPVFAYADEAGIPHEFLHLAWLAFSDRYAGDRKRYADWRAVFRNAVKGNWLKVWYVRDGRYLLSTVGEQWRKVRDAQREAA